MKKLLALSVAILIGLPTIGQAQETLPVVGGKAVLTIVPDTVIVTDTVIPPPIVLPPDTVIVTDTVFVVDTVVVRDSVGTCTEGSLCWPEDEPYCPEGWECLFEPPEPPEPPADTIPPPPLTGTPQITVVDSVATVSWDYPADTEPVEFYVRSGLDAGGQYKELFTQDRVAQFIRSVPGDYFVCIEVRDLAGNWASGSRCNGYTVSFDQPPVPPDTVPPVPPDTVPPEPGDSIPDGTPYLKVQLWQDGILVSELAKDPFPGRTQDTVQAGTYQLLLVENRPLPPWDSVRVGHPVSETVGCETFPCDVYPEGFILNDGELWLDYPVAWDLWGPAETNPEDTLNPEFIDGRLVHFFVPPRPDTTALLIPLDAPQNIRIEQDTLFEIGPVPVVRWDASPQRSQGVNSTGQPANDPDIRGDEVYSVLEVYAMSGERIGLDCDPFLNCSVGYGVFENLHSWGNAIPVPDTIRACVQFEAWDCVNCTGPGGQKPQYVNDYGNVVRAVPVSEKVCETLAVR